MSTTGCGWGSGCLSQAAAASAAVPTDGRTPALSGVGVAAGVASGPARPIRHPGEGTRLQKGDVLVAPSTDPAWTPLFLRASAVVMEVGGYLSHGAIVAREYGIPAVANAADAMGPFGGVADRVPVVDKCTPVVTHLLELHPERPVSPGIGLIGQEPGTALPGRPVVVAVAPPVVDAQGVVEDSDAHRAAGAGQTLSG